MDKGASRFGDNPIMIEAAAALGRSHAERGFAPYWQAIFPKRQAAYIGAYNARKAELANGEPLTAEIIDAAKSPNGGWSRETLALWGVPWPPPKGWKAALIAKTATEGREQ